MWVHMHSAHSAACQDAASHRPEAGGAQQAGESFAAVHAVALMRTQLVELPKQQLTGREKKGYDT
jgi:hypothetical protein